MPGFSLSLSLPGLSHTATWLPRRRKFKQLCLLLWAELVSNRHPTPQEEPTNTVEMPSAWHKALWLHSTIRVLSWSPALESKAINSVGITGTQGRFCPNKDHSHQQLGKGRSRGLFLWPMEIPSKSVTFWKVEIGCCKMLGRKCRAYESERAERKK